MDILFQNALSRMDVGLPDSWDSLLQPPFTAGSFGGYKLVPEELSQVIDGWGLNPGLVDQVKQDVAQFIALESREIVYVEQQFQYNVPGCREESPLSLCMFTLVVVVRQQENHGLAEPGEVELFHLYIESSSNAIQQFRTEKECYRCWLIMECCDDHNYPRDLSQGEFKSVLNVFSTNQYRWGSKHMLFCGSGFQHSHSVFSSPPPRFRRPLRLSSEQTLDKVLIYENDAPEVDSLMVGLGDIKAIWDFVKSIFEQKINEIIQRHVCLSFDKYLHDVMALHIKGLNTEDFESTVDTLISIAKIPPTEEMKALLKTFKLSTDFKWTGETVSYTGSDSLHRFFYLYKYASRNEQGETKLSLTFGVVSSDFSMGPDLMIVHRQSSSWGGLLNQKELIFRNVPHNASANDMKFMSTFFEYIAYRKLAMVTNSPVLAIPDVKGVCDIKI